MPKQHLPCRKKVLKHVQLCLFVSEQGAGEWLRKPFGLEEGVLVYPKSSSDQQISDLSIEKKDSVTNRIYTILLKTIDLSSTDLPKFKSARNDFVTSVKEIVSSLHNA